MTIDKIISVTGKPGLFEIVAQSKGGFIVESLEDKKRFPITASHNVSILNDIAIYTYDEEIPLREVFVSINEKEGGKEALSHKSSNKDLHNFFVEILPEYDQERVYASNIKKVVQWYNILVKNGFDFSSISEENTEEEVAQ